MKIVHVIDAEFPVPGYGGTERVAWWLGKAQAEMGHEVTYLCRPRAQVPFAKVAPLPKNYSDLTPFIPPGTDVVQLYGTPQFRLDYPYLVNIGGNGQPGEIFDPRTVFVSETHARRHNSQAFVHNGLDPAEYDFREQRGARALFLAKASWRVKNLKGAIRAAQAAGVGLDVAGGRAWWWQRGVKSHGEVGGAEKRRLLAEASCLLFPVIWEEPFGLAVVEALVSGAPVVATPRGALPEIIVPGTGFLCESFAELVDSLNRVHELDPAACRARVLEKFTHIHMAQGYERYYKKLLSQGAIASEAPRTPLEQDPQQITLYAGY